jgi:hypothetical protein
MYRCAILGSTMPLPCRPCRPCRYRRYRRRYVLDTREELSAFDGVLLQRQADFALAALKHLARVYGAAAGPGAVPRNGTAGAAGWRAGGGAAAAAAAPRGSIFLVGHSMGGVVARAALVRAEEDPELGARGWGPGSRV